MERSMWSHIGPGAGALLGISAAVMMFLLANQLDGTVDYVSPQASADDVTRFLEANTERIRAISVFHLALASLLVVFVADLFERLREALPGPGRWLSTAFMVGGLLLAGGLVLAAALGYGASIIHDFGEDVQAARAVHALSTDAFGAVIPGVAVMTAAAAAASLKFQALPPWLGLVAVVAFAINLVVFWIPVWVLWVLATSLTLLIRPATAPAPESEPRIKAVRGS